MNRTDKFLSSINEASDKWIPGNVIEKLKLLLLDYIGVTLAGADIQKNKIYRMLAEEDESGQWPIIGMNTNSTLKNAIFYNGLNSHTLDFDDGVNQGIIHLGSPIFSALLPLANKYKANGREVLAAAVAGYETSFTMAMSIQPVHKKSGYHATGTCGTLGVAMAIAKLMKFDYDQQRNAFSIAALSASGSLKVLEDKSELKPYNVAKAALMGYISAQMGRMGFEGPEDVLAGNNGFLRIMTGSEECNIHPPLLNGTYAIEKAYIKPYAACRYCHPAIEASLKLREKYGIKSEDIDTIEVKTYSLAVNKHDHTNIMGYNSAKMSIPYSIAVSYISGKAGIHEYGEEWINNKLVLELSQKVKVCEEPEFTKVFPARTIAQLKMITKNGQEYVETAEYPKGEPENPLSINEVKDKFYRLSQMSGKSKSEQERIVEAVFDFERCYSEFYQLLK